MECMANRYARTQDFQINTSTLGWCEKARLALGILVMTYWWNAAVRDWQFASGGPNLVVGDRMKQFRSKADFNAMMYSFKSLRL